MTQWSDRLREDLCSRAAAYAEKSGVSSYASKGKAAVTLFPLAADGASHGNFAEESYSAINAKPVWRSRLDKSHPRRTNALPAPHDATAKELDSCTSSDALLMNVFCYPGIVSGAIAALMHVASGTEAAFGIGGHVPLKDGTTDATEIDMRLGETNVEAKLTESTFVSRERMHVERYAGLEDVFDSALLATDGDEFQSYQLIRNVLAIVHRPTAHFIVLLDARRPDLMREWWVTHAAIRGGELRARCGFVTWQELAAAAPAKLQSFLSRKYGL